MTDDKQTEQSTNEHERRSEDELWKEFLSVSFYNMLRSVLPDLASVAEEGVYRWEGYGSEVTYRYPVFRIYEGDEDALRKSDNPFDLAHYAGMQAWKQQSNDVRKLDYMKILLAELNKRGWSHEEKMTLLWFIEGVMHIEDEYIWNEWEEELESRKEAGDMYVSLMERKGIEKGMEKGIEKGIEKGMALKQIAMTRKMLAAGEPDDKILAYAEITPEQLEKIREENSSSIH